MRILSLILLSFVISAATEIEIDCGTLGYELISDDSSFQETCESWLVCPANTNYKICTKWKTDYIYTKDTCPTGATCEQEDKYRLIGCKKGYTEKYDDGKIVACEMSCEGYDWSSIPENASSYDTCTKADGTQVYKITKCNSGYKLAKKTTNALLIERLEIVSDKSECISTECITDTYPPLSCTGHGFQCALTGNNLKVSSYYTFEDGSGYVVESTGCCLQQLDSSGSGCIYYVPAPGSTGGDSGTSCPYASAAEACAACSNNVVLSNGCYSCGTSPGATSFYCK